jgi:signal transduction histidine kinase
MIGGVLVVLGLLLTLAALVGARVIGARRDRIIAVLVSPLEPATWESLLAIGAGVVVVGLGGALAISLLSAGLSLVLFGVGVVLVGLGVELCRGIAVLERRRVSIPGHRGGPSLHPHPYRARGRTLPGLLRATFLDLNRWRDVVYVLVAWPLTVLEFAVVAILWGLVLVLLAIPIGFAVEGPAVLAWLPGATALGADRLVAAAGFGVGLVFAPVASEVTKGLLTLHRAVVAGLLCESEQRTLRRQVERLEGSRRAVIDAEASELRRIERDLHDGAQQRLVMLAMDLGRAAERIDDQPEQAREIVLAARDHARQTLAELRDLVRGIAPAILVDRGLVPAIESLAGGSAVPAIVSNSLPGGLRLPEPVERAAYFVVAESLANIAKHASDAATRCEIAAWRDGPNLVVDVRDDGPGGARVVAGGGLAGLAGRVEALDGRLSVVSPVHGGTHVRAVIPVPDWAAGVAGGVAAAATERREAWASGSQPAGAAQDPR